MRKNNKGHFTVRLVCKLL